MALFDFLKRRPESEFQRDYDQGLVERARRAREAATRPPRPSRPPSLMEMLRRRRERLASEGLTDDYVDVELPPEVEEKEGFERIASKLAGRRSEPRSLDEIITERALARHRPIEYTSDKLRREEAEELDRAQAVREGREENAGLLEMLRRRRERLASEGRTDNAVDVGSEYPGFELMYGPPMEELAIEKPSSPMLTDEELEMTPLQRLNAFRRRHGIVEEPEEVAEDFDSHLFPGLSQLSPSLKEKFKKNRARRANVEEDLESFRQEILEDRKSRSTPRPEFNSISDILGG